MKVTLCAALPAVGTTLAAVYANHFHPSEPGTIAVTLGMFASWGISGFVVSVYRSLRIVRGVFRRQSSRSLRRIDPAAVASPDYAGAELVAMK